MLICGRNMHQIWTDGKSIVQLVIAHPANSRYVSSGNKPARIEVRLRQIQASRLRKPRSRFKVEGGTYVLSKKWSLTTSGLIETALVPYRGVLCVIYEGTKTQG